MSGEGPSTPSAPSTDELNRITTLDDILKVQENDLPEAYVQSMQEIHQYSAEDIHKVLSEVPLSALSELHSVLCAKVSAAHEAFQGRRIIKRNVVRTAATDVINLGLCLVSGEVNQDLDKIFLERLKGAATQMPDDIYSKYVELLDMVTNYAKRLESVESELRSLKSKSTVLVTQSNTNGSIDSDVATTVNNQILSGAPSTSTEREHQSTDSPPVVPQHPVIQNSPPPSSTRLEVSSPSLTVAPSSSTGAITTTTATLPASVVSSSSLSRVKAARSTQSRNEPDAEIYIGGAAGTVTCEDVQFELSKIGVQVDISNVRTLSDKQDWKSFVAKIPKSKEQSVCSHANWSKDLRIRPFRAPGADKSQKARQHEESRWKRPQRSNQKWTHKQQRQPRRSWNRKQRPSAPQSCECQAPRPRWSSHDYYPEERQSDWGNYIPNDAPYINRDWYDNEFPTLDRSYHNYRY